MTKGDREGQIFSIPSSHEYIRIFHECEDGIEKIHPEDRRLASRGLLRDVKR